MNEHTLKWPSGRNDGGFGCELVMFGEWLSPSRNPGEVSPRQTKYVDSFAFEHAHFAFEHANAGTPLGKDSLH